jgi:hypothetical protein
MMLHANVRLHHPASGVDRLPPEGGNDSKQSWNNSERGDRVLITEKLYAGAVCEEGLIEPRSSG